MLHIINRDDDNFFARESICVLNNNFESITTPNNTTEVTLVRGLSFMFNLKVSMVSSNSFFSNII
jgi:hypothetical protein